MAFPHHSSTLLPASGFHPTLKTTIRHLRPLGAGMSSTTRDDASDVQQDSELNNHYTSSCSLHLLYTFSSSVILDQYQLAQLHDEGRLVKSRRSIITDDGSSGSSQGKDSASPVQSELFLGGQLDLEAPVERIRPDEGALAFLSIPMASGATRRSSDQAPSPDSPSVDVVVEMPLHLRYQEPVASRWLSAQGWSGFGGHWWNKHPMPEGWQDIVEVNVDWPCVFWACDKEQPDIVGNPQTPYRLMDAENSCLNQVPLELRRALPESSPLNPTSPLHYHYLLPLGKDMSDLAAGSPGSSSVRVPTGVLGDLGLVSLVNYTLIWLSVCLLSWKVWQVSRPATKTHRSEPAKGHQRKTQ